MDAKAEIERIFHVEHGTRWERRMCGGIVTVISDCVYSDIGHQLIVREWPYDFNISVLDLFEQFRLVPEGVYRFYG